MARLFSEATPYIQKYHGKTMVVKYGGNAMINEELKNAVMNDLVTLTLLGVRVVLVHGGGPAINEMLKKVGVESHFANDRSGRKYYSDDFYIFYSAVIKGIYHLYFKCIKPSGGCRSYEQSGHRCTCRIAASHSSVCRRLDIQYDKET